MRELNVILLNSRGTFCECLRDLPAPRTETESRSINMQNKNKTKQERCQHPAILREWAWSIRDLLYEWRTLFYCGTKRVIPNGQDSPILHLSIFFVCFSGSRSLGHESESLGKLASQDSESASFHGSKAKQLMGLSGDTEGKQDLWLVFRLSSDTNKFLSDNLLNRNPCVQSS